jgi:hypothetical protein
MQKIVSLSFVLVQEPLANSLLDLFLIMGQKSWNPPRTDFAEPKVLRDNGMCTSITYIHFRSNFINRKAPIAFNEVTDHSNIVIRQTCPWTPIVMLILYSFMPSLKFAGPVVDLGT